MLGTSSEFANALPPGDNPIAVNKYYYYYKNAVM